MARRENWPVKNARCLSKGNDNDDNIVDKKLELSLLLAILEVISVLEKSWRPTMTQVPQTSVRRKIEEPANKPTPVLNTYSCVSSFVSISPEATLHNLN